METAGLFHPENPLATGLADRRQDALPNSCDLGYPSPKAQATRPVVRKDSARGEWLLFFGAEEISGASPLQIKNASEVDFRPHRRLAMFSMTDESVRFGPLHAVDGGVLRNLEVSVERLAFAENVELQGIDRL
jgi:hypothetical protein